MMKNYFASFHPAPNSAVRWFLLWAAGVLMLALLLTGQLNAQETVQTRSEPLQLSSTKWESLGFSPDGKFFGSITYGVEHDLSREESHFFARLHVFHLKGKDDEIVLERVLRRSVPLRAGLTARAIMQALLRRESKELRHFQIEALEQGDILLALKQSQGQAQAQTSGQEAVELAPAGMELEEGQTEGEAVALESPVESEKQALGEFDVAIEELAKVRDEQAAAVQQMSDVPNPLDRIYISVKNANTTVFQFRQLRLDSVQSLRGQLVVVQSKGFPHRYTFQQNWNTLLQDNLLSNSQLNVEPAFIALSPDATHLLLTLRIYGSLDGLEVGLGQDGENLASAENVAKLQNILYRQLERDGNYAYVTFSVQVY